MVVLGLRAWCTAQDDASRWINDGQAGAVIKAVLAHRVCPGCNQSPPLTPILSGEITESEITESLNNWYSGTRDSLWIAEFDEAL